MPGFDIRQCTAGITVNLDPNTPSDPAFTERTNRVGKELLKEGVAIPPEELEELNKKAAEELYERLKTYGFAGQESTATVPAPGCTQQGPQKSIYGPGSKTLYQQTFEQTGK